MQTDVSILLATYSGDSPELLHKSLESLEHQTLPPDEVILVESGALTQAQREVIEEKQKQLPLRRVLKEKNEGLGAALAEGLKHARCEWVARIDADDIAFTDRLERQNQHLIKNPGIDILGGGAVEIDYDGNIGKTRVMPTKHDKISKTIWACPVIHPSVTFRRRRILEVGNYNPSLPRGQDYELWFRALHNGLRFENLPDPVVYYRFSQDNIRRQPPRECFVQGQIGWRGCRMLGLPLWQHLAVWYPFARSLLPLPLAEAAYRFSQRIDPRLAR
ncbi:glycosyltransferase [Halorhodospira halophila]|uniref:Glycosyl transferase, family 2 n=1 Tax=Halorhodospira halophila (strain DSM 244 / SL1) TaxID=349124 RepID=A1WV48_HALHL|nr:glycosyltransferase [Halorhodospira halophila]ABM61560.1 glycosyl transferase, family 2 [Halorhodospira halophila SL1]MBK1728806.1 hypothetical protein [Halorhodospira halophila]